MHSGMRITTNAMIRRYSTNLNKALGDLDSTRNTVTTNRNFNKVSEDPAAAMKSFKLRSNFARTEVQMDNTKDALAKLDEVTSNVLNCNSMGRTFIADSLLSYSGPTRAFASRQAYMQEIDQLVESFLQQMNGKYNENFIFGGASTKELPFTKETNPVTKQEEIFYRGVPVSTNSYLTFDDLKRILSQAPKDPDDPNSANLGLGLRDGVEKTDPPLTTTLDDIMGTTTTTTGNPPTTTTTPNTEITVNELYKALASPTTTITGADYIGPTGAQNKLLANEVFQISGVQVKAMLSNLGLNNLEGIYSGDATATPPEEAYEPFDELASDPSLDKVYAKLMGDDYANDSKTISYADLMVKIDDYTDTIKIPDRDNDGKLLRDDKEKVILKTVNISDLKKEVDNLWENETLTKDEVEAMLTDAGLKNEELSRGLDGVDGPSDEKPLTDLVNKIMKNVKEKDENGNPTKINCDDLEKAIDALDISESQKYQLKSLTEIGYQLKLSTYFNEHSYRDIGFGMKETPEDVLISTSAFDTAVNGLKVFGYGMDDAFEYTNEEGVTKTYKLPNNIVALAKELSQTLSVDSIEDFDQDKHDAIINKMRQCYDDMSDNGLAALGTKCKFLETTHDQLTEASQILNEQISDLDFCDPAEAITNLMWAQYAYNATLKVGNTLLSNSFIDFMS